MSTPTFVNPPPFGKVGDYSNLPNLVIGSTYMVNWTGFPEGAESDLWLIQDGASLFCADLNLAEESCQSLLSGQTSNSWQWVLQQPENYTSSDTFYFLSMRFTNTTEWFASHYFNILPQGSLPSTSTNAVPSATGSPAVSAQSTSAGLSSGTKIAIGVAVGAGVPFLIVLGLIAFFLYKGSKKRAAPKSLSEGSPFYSATPSKASYGMAPQWEGGQDTARSWSPGPQMISYQPAGPPPQELANQVRSPQELYAIDTSRNHADPAELPSQTSA